MSAHAAHIRNIGKLIESVRYRHDVYQVFSDCMEAMAISCSNAVDLRQRDAREARYMEIVRRYDRDTIQTFPKILGELTMAMEAAPGDVLGAVFGQLEIHNTARGQFFTPYELARLMARLQIGDGAQMRSIIERHGFALAQEPACGAGAMVIALAQEMQDAGINYQRHLHVTAIDVDARAAHMAYVQFTLLHIPAVVIVGNTLTMEMREQWYTPAHILGGWNWRLAARSAAETVRTLEATTISADRTPLAPIASATAAAAQLTLF
jgi:hypothetical protein